MSASRTFPTIQISLQNTPYKTKKSCNLHLLENNANSFKYGNVNIHTWYGSGE